MPEETVFATRVNNAIKGGRNYLEGKQRGR